MRIVIDLQAAQAENGRRGIGRLALSLARAMAADKNHDEVLIAVNGIFEESIPDIRRAFKGLLPDDAIRVWQGLPDCSHRQSSHQTRREVAALIRESFLLALEPSVILVMSFFEGLVDDAVTTLGKLPHSCPTAIILYDLIPLIYQTHYLRDPEIAGWYRAQFDMLKKADLLLCISDSTRQEAFSLGGFAENRAITIHAGKADYFCPSKVPAERAQALLGQYGIHQRFVLYGGGIDFRKNVEGLIQAFGQLPKDTLHTHQLVILCAIEPPDRQRLLALAKRSGLPSGGLILTGYVPEPDLVDLYRLCGLFVFPSFHEGFGLPVLEAMACGAPVIGANASSIPEVVGLEEALFDPRDENALLQKLLQGLTDEGFRSHLCQHAAVQSQKFSWNASAQKSLTALRNLERSHVPMETPQFSEAHKPRLAILSPLPPERSGIADYTAELLRALEPYYLLDVVITQSKISDPWILDHCRIKGIEDFKADFASYDRVLYQFGNSAFHSHLFDLLEDYPGFVTLHDFFLSGVLAHRDAHEGLAGSWPRKLYESHGYLPLQKGFKADSAELIWNYPANLSVLQNALGIIVHSPQSLSLALEWYGLPPQNWSVIPHLRVATDPPSDFRLKAKQTLGLEPEEVLVCVFGHLGPTKLNHRVLDAWRQSDLHQDPHCHLVFVGQNPMDEYGEQLNKTVRKTARAAITGWVDHNRYRTYLEAADIAVQLRTSSRGESSGAVFDCMNHKIALIVNQHGTMRDLPEGTATFIEDHFTDRELTEALQRLVNNSTLRATQTTSARQHLCRDHDPKACGRAYWEAIEATYRRHHRQPQMLLDRINHASPPLPAKDLPDLAQALARTFHPSFYQRQLLVDVSELVQRDVRTGIQRVVRNILREWLKNPPMGFRIEPVFATENDGYRYARRFTLAFLEASDFALEDEPIDFRSGDLFVGLDLQPSVIPIQAPFFKTLRAHGVRTVFVLYDLLCIRLPETFPDGADQGFKVWLRTISEADRVVAISRSVREDYALWLDEEEIDEENRPRLDWFPLGSNLDASAPSLGLPDDCDSLLSQISARPTFLMLGTLEPRKAHAQALLAFDQLWQEGNDLGLVIVGKQGWMVEDLVARLEHHPERNQRLFWLGAISDEFLKRIMTSVTALVAPSLGEGFGLPLIEAAQQGLPVIARNLPVFREVAGPSTLFFEGREGRDLAKALSNWLASNRQSGRDTFTKVQNDQTLTDWSESARALFEAAIKD